MLTVVLVLVVAAFILTLVAAVRPNWVPLWVAVLCLVVIELLRALPTRMILIFGLAGSLFVAATGCSVCSQIEHRNDVKCVVKDAVVDCTEAAAQSMVAEFLPVVQALVATLFGAGGVDWGVLEKAVASLGLRDGVCILTALEDELLHPAPELSSSAPALAAASSTARSQVAAGIEGVKHKLWPGIRARTVQGIR